MPTRHPNNQPNPSITPSMIYSNTGAGAALPGADALHPGGPLLLPHEVLLRVEGTLLSCLLFVTCVYVYIICVRGGIYTCVYNLYVHVGYLSI